MLCPSYYVLYPESVLYQRFNMASNDCFSAHNYRARNNVPGHCTNATQRAFLKDRLHTQWFFDMATPSILCPQLHRFEPNDVL